MSAALKSSKRRSTTSWSSLAWLPCLLRPFAGVPACSASENAEDTLLSADDSADDDSADDDADDDVLDDDFDDDADDDADVDDAGLSPNFGDAGADDDASDAGADDDASDAGFVGDDDAGATDDDAGEAPQLTFEDLIVAQGVDGGVSSVPLTSTRVPRVSAPCGDLITEGRVFEWLPDSSGTLTVSVEGDAPHQVLLQSNCGQPNTTKECTPLSTSSELSVAFTAGEPLCLVLGFSGNLTASVRLQGAECGDGIVNAPAEECDFGDQLPGDGCDALCRFEPARLEDGNACPGRSESIFDSLELGGYTVGFSDGAPPSCGALEGGRDKIYKLVPAQDGRLTATLSADFDAVLSLFTECRNDNTLTDVLACSDRPSASAPEQISFDVDRLGEYYLVVDGYAADEMGAFSLSLELQPNEPAPLP